jgi:hypothetical protein
MILHSAKSLFIAVNASLCWLYNRAECKAASRLHLIILNQVKKVGVAVDSVEHWLSSEAVLYSVQ